MSNVPIRTLTELYLKALSRLDLSKLEQLVTPNTLRVEVDPNGHPLILQGSQEWLTYLRNAFMALQPHKDQLDWEILAFEEHTGPELSTVTMKYRDHTLLGGQLAQQIQYVTMVWRQTDEGWRLGHWHASRLEVRAS